VFYGCSAYPTCDFSVRQRPFPEPCPECGELLVAAGKTGARCTVCEYKGEVPQPEQESELEPAEVAI
jgi:DNA topoisomerase-1